MMDDTFQRSTVVLVGCLLVALVADSLFAQRRRRVGGRRPARHADTIRKGDVAPDFTLYRLDGDETVRLSEFRGSKPVALVFGSYT